MDRKRRRIMQAIAAGAATSLVGCNDGDSSVMTPGGSRGAVDSDGAGSRGGRGETVPRVDFRHGVASGDPLADRVMLWTRVTPKTTATNHGRIPVTAVVAADPQMMAPVARYDSTASVDHDFTVKIDAAGLAADRWYYYRFAVGDQRSPIGRTRTLPAPGAPVKRARIATISCASYAKGYFSVYRALAEQQDLDLVLHLGDYIYDYGPGEYSYPLGLFPDLPERELDPPHETVTLDDYRRRYALHRRDPDMQALHQQFPMIAVWDDHETANNSYEDGAGNHQPATEGDWQVRKDKAQRAYFEWLPIREQEPGNFDRIYRRFVYGDLIDLSMLDTRLEGRDLQVDTPIDPARNDPDRHIISPIQMDWLLSNLSNATARWRLIGQQVMFAQLNVAEIPTLDERRAQLRGSLSAVNVDQWDGYAADRLQILNHIADNGIDNVVVLGGDIHSSWASEIYRNPASLLGDLYEPPLAAEFVTPSVTSPGLPAGAAEVAGTVIGVIDPHVRYLEGRSHGFTLLDIDRQRVQAEYHYVSSITARERSGEIDDARTKLLAVYNGDSRLLQNNLRMSRPRLDTPERAPATTNTREIA